MTDRFEDKGDFVLDHKTGLEWRKDYKGGVTWQRAMDYAASLGNSWRLPTIEELITLIDFSRHNPASTFPGMPPGWLWSSSSFASSGVLAWLVYFASGHVDGDTKTHTGNARYVRGPHA